MSELPSHNAEPNCRWGGIPLAFTPEFYEDENKVKQWTAFCSKNKPYIQDLAFKDVIARLTSFLVPVIMSGRGERTLDSTWTPANGWQPALDQ